MLATFPVFLSAMNTLRQSSTLANTLLQKLKLITLDCYGDFEDLCEY